MLDRQATVARATSFTRGDTGGNRNTVTGLTADQESGISAFAGGHRLKILRVTEVVWGASAGQKRVAEKRAGPVDTQQRSEVGLNVLEQCSGRRFAKSG